MATLWLGWGLMCPTAWCSAACSAAHGGAMLTPNSTALLCFHRQSKIGVKTERGTEPNHTACTSHFQTELSCTEPQSELSSPNIPAWGRLCPPAATVPLFSAVSQSCSEAAALPTAALSFVASAWRWRTPMGRLLAGQTVCLQTPPICLPCFPIPAAAA